MEMRPPTGSALMRPLISHMGVVPNIWTDFQIQLFRQFDVLFTIPRHSLLGVSVSINDLDPEIDAFVFELPAETEERPDEAQLIHEVPVFLDGLQEIDAGDLWRSFEPVEKELAFEFPEIVLVAVICNNGVGVRQHLVRPRKHLFVTVLPFRIEMDLFLSEPLHPDTEETAVFDDLICRDILFPRSPDIGLSGLPLYV